MPKVEGVPIFEENNNNNRWSLSQKIRNFLKAEKSDLAGRMKTLHEVENIYKYLFKPPTSTGMLIVDRDLIYDYFIDKFWRHLKERKTEISKRLEKNLKTEIGQNLSCKNNDFEKYVSGVSKYFLGEGERYECHIDLPTLKEYFENSAIFLKVKADKKDVYDELAKSKSDDGLYCFLRLQISIRIEDRVLELIRPDIKNLIDCYEKVASVICHIVGLPDPDNPIEEEENFITDFISLIVEFGHRIVKVDRSIDLKSLFNKFVELEPSIYLTEKYRDHILHTIMVTILGHILLESKLEDGKTTLAKLMVEIYETSPKKPNIKNEEEVKKAWFIAALIHDIGYGIKILDSIEHYLTPPSLSEPFGVFLNSIDNIIRKEAEKYDAKIVTRKPHGLVSALFLASLRDYKGWKELPFVKIAERTVVKHDSEDTVNFWDDPLPFLLIFVDEIQEFSRPNISRELLIKKILYEIHAEGYVKEIKSPVPISKLSINLERSGDFCYKLPSALKITLSIPQEEVANKEFEKFIKNVPTFFIGMWLGKLYVLKRLSLGTNQGEHKHANVKAIEEIAITLEVPNRNNIEKFEAISDFGYWNIKQWKEDAKVVLEPDGSVERFIFNIGKTPVELPKYFIPQEANQQFYNPGHL